MTQKRFLKTTICLCFILTVTLLTYGPILAKEPKTIELSFAHTIPPVIPFGKLCRRSMTHFHHHWASWATRQ